VKRLAILLVVSVLAAAAFVVNPPADLDPLPASTTTTISELDEPVSRFFHCPWAYADGISDTSISLVTEADTEYRVSLPVNGDVTTVSEAAMAAGAAVGIPVSTVQPVGASSAIVEFSNGPAAAGVLSTGAGFAAGDACPSRLPRIWHLGGGTTADGQLLTLRLFNPFADAARVDLTAVSELGAEAASGFEGVSIPARSTRTIEISTILPGRDRLSLFIEQIEGSVIPAFVLDGATGDRALWSGTRQSEAWEVPLTVDQGLEGAIVLTNSSLVAVTYSIDVFDREATVTTPVTGEIPGPGQVVVALDQLGAGVFGARVSGDGPFGAVVVGSGEGAVAATPAAPGTSTGWLLPGVSADTGAGYRMWVLNTGVDDITVSYRSADAGGGADNVKELVVAAGAVASVDVTEVGTSGVIAEAAAPFSAAWSVSNGTAVAYVAGVPVGG
jgi:hypothetical protein